MERRAPPARLSILLVRTELRSERSLHVSVAGPQHGVAFVLCRVGRPQQPGPRLDAVPRRARAEQLRGGRLRDGVAARVLQSARDGALEGTIHNVRDLPARL